MILGSFLAWTNALENALITFISSEYLRLRVDLEHRLVERQVGVLEILVQLLLEHVLGSVGIVVSPTVIWASLPPSPARRIVGSVRSEAGRLSDGLSDGASAVIAVAGCGGSKFMTNCTSAGAGL